MSVGHGDTVTLAGDAGPGDWSLTTGSDESGQLRALQSQCLPTFELMLEDIDMPLKDNYGETKTPLIKYFSYSEPAEIIYSYDES